MKIICHADWGRIALWENFKVLLMKIHKIKLQCLRFPLKGHTKEAEETINSIPNLPSLEATLVKSSQESPTPLCLSVPIFKCLQSIKTTCLGLGRCLSPYHCLASTSLSLDPQTSHQKLGCCGTVPGTPATVRWEVETSRSLEAHRPVSQAYVVKFPAKERWYLKSKLEGT